MQHLPAFEHGCNRGVLFEFLEQTMRISERVAIIQPYDQSQVQKIILHSVHEPAAKCVSRNRIAQRMHDKARFDTPFWQLPDLLDSARVDLRVAAFVEVEFLNGSVYRYFDVALPIFEQLLGTESKGAFFNRVIRGRYSYSRMGFGRTAK